MDPLRTLTSRLASLFRRSKLDADLDEELRSHLALAMEENMQRDMSRKEARKAALRSFGGIRRLGGCCGLGGGRRDLSDEVGEHAAEAPARGAAGKAAVLLERFVSSGNRELLIEDASAGEAEGFA